MTATVDQVEAVEPALLARPVPVPLEAPSRAPRPDHTRAGWLIAIVLIGGLLRVWGLGASRLSYDESFTAMVGRLPVGGLFEFLRAHDSHPPIDYLVRLPLARAGVDEFWFRLPSAVFSIGALALFAWWMRNRGRVGVIATALMAVSAFQVQHARQARMYAEMELLGVAVAVLAAAWLRRPRRWHAPLLGVLVFMGLLTHASMFLLAAGMFLLPGNGTDREAWRWRAAIVGGALGWLILWGPTFVTQAGGGHSAWIPATTLNGLVTALGRLTTVEPRLALVAVGATVAGGMMLWRADQVLGRLWVCCFVVPVAIAALVGLAEPVVIDRTFTVIAWAPLLAIAFLLEALARRRLALGAVAMVGLLAVIVPSTVNSLTQPAGPDTPLRRLEQVVRPGDIVAVRPASKAPELQWSLGVRGRYPARPVATTLVPRAFGLAVGSATSSGRLWLLDWHTYPAPTLAAYAPCASRWSWGHTHIRCVLIRPAANAK